MKRSLEEGYDPLDRMRKLPLLESLSQSEFERQGAVMESAIPLISRRNGSKKRKASSINYVVIGGGIAGVSCAKEIARLKLKDEDSQVILITATELLKEVCNRKM
jgi:hypothetical protein